jgi:transketolase
MANLATTPGQKTDLTSQLANCIRFLSIDAVNRANSGHPGMPMGMADVATVLFTEFLKFNPNEPKWLDRDRFILSAGHGSMLIYALLHLSGYKDVSLDDLKDFRQIHAKCAGHPEYGHLDGIETTTGPLGQGIANAVGMAISERMSAAQIGENLIDHKTYCIVGDGCLMEGISQEAISLAGHLKLNKLIVLWDNNDISIDGKISITSSENMKMRFEACGWNVISIDGHNTDEVRNALKQAQNSDKPIMIDCKTTIGFGSPNKAGSEKVHGAPLGEEEATKTREALGWTHAPFEIPQNLQDEWLKAGTRSLAAFDKWTSDFNQLDQHKIDEINRVLNNKLPQDFDAKLTAFKQKTFDEAATIATRKASQNTLEFLTGELPELVGGSADLTGSVLTKTSHTESMTSENFANRYIHYGIREHAMGAIMNGIALHSNLIPYAGTFAVFSDYMKPSLRLAALMKQQTIYVFTHDSIGLGEDGPTHQPIEHLAMLRGIPNLNVFRPADAFETIECYEAALHNKKTPSALILTRQGLPLLQPKFRSENFSARGGYVLCEEANPDVVILASGSEVETAVATKDLLKAQNIKARVVSMPCLDLFEQQDDAYKAAVLGDKNTLKVAIEAAIAQGWHKYIDSDGIFIGMDDFGASGKASDLFEHFGITAQAACQKIVARLQK